MNFENAQNKSPQAINSPQTALIRSFQTSSSNSLCSECGSLNQFEASRCAVCGSELAGEETAAISLKGTLLFFSVLLLIALNVAPVWSSDLIYGKAIFFLQKVGVFLPHELSEAEKYRAMVSNIIDVYHTLNLVYYITIALLAFLFIFDWLRGQKGIAGFPKAVWLFLGGALLVFPLTNLLVSWNMFLTPGVIGSTIAALIILFAGLIDKQV